MADCLPSLFSQNNILFGKPYDEDRYWAAIKASCLETDLQILPGGDQTSIGERGINLSGGQRQRVSIARLLYSDTPIVFLDDPLSAVDAHVGKALFFDAIQGALAGKTRVLVTHQLHFLPYVDEVILLEKGQIVEQGPYQDLMDSDGALTRLMRDFGNVEEEEEELEKEEEAIEDVAATADKRRQTAVDRAKMSNTSGGKLIVDEERYTGECSIASL